jgi:hypothetical protein
MIFHTPYASEKMQQLYDSKMNGDVTFQIEDRKFVGHSAYLTACSSIFAELMNTKSESQEITIDPSLCTPEEFEQLLLYLYKGEGHHKETLKLRNKTSGISSLL